MSHAGQGSFLTKNQNPERSNSVTDKACAATKGSFSRLHQIQKTRGEIAREVPILDPLSESSCTCWVLNRGDRRPGQAGRVSYGPDSRKQHTARAAQMNHRPDRLCVGYRKLRNDRCPCSAYKCPKSTPRSFVWSVSRDSTEQRQNTRLTSDTSDFSQNLRYLFLSQILCTIVLSSSRKVISQQRNTHTFS